MIMLPKTKLKFFFLIAVLYLLRPGQVLGQAPTTYSSLYASNNFAKIIDVSRPVGKIAGMADATATGGATYTIPILMPLGTNNIEPKLSLSYNSQAGNGIAGFGWNLSGLSAIGRSTKNSYNDNQTNPVTLRNADAFTLDGQRLSAITGNNGEDATTYSTEVEGYSLIISHGNYAQSSGAYTSTDAPLWFEVTTKEGMTMEFGNTPDSRLIRPDLTYNLEDKVLLWRINKIKDVNGNYINFIYSGYTISEITYTSNDITGLQPFVRVLFSYTQRMDKNTIFEGGTFIPSTDLLDKITIQSLPNYDVIKEYQLSYGFKNQYSFLKEINEQGATGTKLNSSIFLYGDDPQNLATTSVSGSFTNSDLVAGDFDADGKSDFLAATVYYENVAGYNIKHHSNYKLLGNVSYGYGDVLYNTSLPSGSNVAASFNGSESLTFSRDNFLTNDFDGDGRDDVFFIETGTTAGSGSTTSWVKGLNINYTKGYNYTTLETDYISSQFPKPAYSSGGYYEWIHSKGHFFIPGDFDGDGLQDYILVLAHTNSTGNFYKAFFSSPNKGIFNTEVSNFGYGTNTYGSYYATSVASSDQVIPVDINGDGKMELLVVASGSSYIMEFQISSTVASASSYPISLSTNSGSKFLLGDFNGDRKTDLLIRNGTNAWNIALSNGKGFLESAFTFQQPVQYNGTYSDHKVLVADFNGDGKSDILHGYNYFVGGVASTSKLSLYYSQGVTNTGLTFTPQFAYEQYTYNTILQFTQPLIGDFNGDGRADFINWYNNSADIVYIKPEGTERLLAKVADGHKQYSSFMYGKITDNPSFYQRETSLDDAMNTHPINVSMPAMYCVSSITSAYGSQILYSYKDAIIHRSGRGFLGFKKTLAQNLTMGTETETLNGLSTDFATLYNVSQSNRLTSNSQLISENKVWTSFNTLSIFPKHYQIRTDKKLSINYLLGTASETLYTYDGYGNVTDNVLRTGTLSGNSVNPVETVSTIISYANYGGVVPSKPVDMNVISDRNGSPTLTKLTKFSYSSTGLLTSKTDFAGLTNEITSNFTYDALGNIISSNSIASGVMGCTTTFTYDNSGRFIVQKQVSGNGVSSSENTTYHDFWGKPLTKSDGCNTSTFTYDGFGRLASTTFPDNTVKTTHLSWRFNKEKIYEIWDEYSGGKPDVRTWCDGLDRAKQTETVGFNGLNIIQTTVYDGKGNIYRKSAPYYGGETPLYTYSTYDDYNRLISTYNSLSATNYIYNNFGGGLNGVTISNATGQATSKITDAAGRVIQSTDDGGDLTFTYNSWGQQLTVEHAGSILSTRSYDQYGNEQDITEANSGITRYGYNGFRKLIYQQDANGNQYNLDYDDFGRLVRKTGSEGTTIFSYDNNPSNCSSFNKLIQITGYNGVIKSYDYDALGRTVREINNIDGTTFVTSYTYNAYSQVETVDYGYGFVKKLNYDYSGYLTSIEAGANLGSLNTVYTNNDQNGFGQNTSYTLGNGLTSTNHYNFGIPSQFYTPGIQDLNFTFDNDTRNLLNRTDNIKGFSEDFIYDNLNRLTTMTVNGSIQNQINYDAVGGSKGNIVYKADVGNYVYSTNRVHAVKNIDNAAGNFSTTAAQNINYTPFLRPENIDDGQNSLNITYGFDYERVKTRFLVGHSVPREKFFLPDFEKMKFGSNEKYVNYINGVNGLVAIAVTENGNTSIYYVYTDHLGSILTVTNGRARVEAEQNFDAWGRNRDVNNWNAFLPTTGSIGLPDWLSRGYTGHEHLREFGIINMNARLYDPVLGRMMEPDNFVQEPYNTQSQNRYSYCINNPLKYKDPTGNFFIIDDFIFNFIGGLFETGGSLGDRLSNAWSNGIKGANNALKIYGGLFQGDFGQIVSRLTWQSPQTLLGLAVNETANTFDLVQNVDYFDGATVTTTKINNWGAFTLGSYILGDQTLRADPRTALFQHEYGHYLQSQKSGPLYLAKYALPSFANGIFSSAEGHNNYWTEQDANLRALQYWRETVPGFTNSNWDFNSNPINVGSSLHQPHWWEWITGGSVITFFTNIFGL